jgi:hypothetical protein
MGKFSAWDSGPNPRIPANAFPQTTWLRMHSYDGVSVSALKSSPDRVVAQSQSSGPGFHPEFRHQKSRSPKSLLSGPLASLSVPMQWNGLIPKSSPSQNIPIIPLTSPKPQFLFCEKKDARSWQHPQPRISSSPASLDPWPSHSVLVSSPLYFINSTLLFRSRWKTHPGHTGQAVEALWKKTRPPRESDYRRQISIWRLPRARSGRGQIHITHVMTSANIRSDCPEERSQNRIVGLFEIESSHEEWIPDLGKQRAELSNKNSDPSAWAR